MGQQIVENNKKEKYQWTIHIIKTKKLEKIFKSANCKGQWLPRIWSVDRIQ